MSDRLQHLFTSSFVGLYATTRCSMIDVLGFSGNILNWKIVLHHNGHYWESVFLMFHDHFNLASILCFRSFHHFSLSLFDSIMLSFFSLGAYLQNKAHALLFWLGRSHVPTIEPMILSSNPELCRFGAMYVKNKNEGILDKQNWPNVFVFLDIKPRRKKHIYKDQKPNDTSYTQR